MNLDNLPKELFPKLAMVGYSFVNAQDQKELNLYNGIASEHSFHAFITDPAAIAELNLNNKTAICSINYPYPSLLEEDIIVMVKGFQKKFPKLKGYLISLNKYNIVKERWDRIRDFLKDLDETIEGEIYVSIDVRWFKSGQALAHFFSIAGFYKKISLVISCHGHTKDINVKDLQDWAFAAKTSALNPVMYFGPPPSEVEAIIALLDAGFDYIAIPFKLGVEFVTRL